ncbi:hypothetical protein L1765_03825 [Microaerobacter geothermalis]|uniref:nucleoside recognition domain-containing protein n=1 Tax=Microaerobacter geothermalis TaxID=674972 RepID=UPI001F33664B|nr:nucleoside recognition domain-containing protein [Microaerobacter geothermalis]MCF6093123.1 hypothetical protein [Microaerobacter geothermalis]
MNYVFFFLISFGIVVAAITGNIQSVTTAAIQSANSAIERIIQLMGIITLWLGLAKVAEKGGILRGLARALYPFIRWLFPSIPARHPAIQSILMNMSANILGLGSAATPFGLKAMEELQKLNQDPKTASEAMCTFLALNTSSLTIIPSTIIAIRLSLGSENPAEIISTTLLASATATITAVLLDFYFRKKNSARGDGHSI